MLQGENHIVRWDAERIRKLQDAALALSCIITSHSL